MKMSIFSVNCIVRLKSDVQKISDKWDKVHFALEVNQEQHIYTKCNNVTFCIYGIFVNFYLK